MPVFLDGGGQCGALIKARDWSGTLGPVETWPQSLKAATGLLLRSPVPMVMLWGEDGIMLYNDAYSVFAGGRHPELLGSRVREGWPEVADFNDHVMTVGLAGGTLSYKDQELTLYRHGQPEQVCMDLDYSPVIGDDGRPAGVLAIVIETTDRVAAERRAAAEQERQRRYLQQMPGFAAVLSGPEHRFDYVNDAYVENFGPGEFLGRTVREAFPEIAGQGFYELLDTVYRTGEPFTARNMPIALKAEAGIRYVNFLYEPIKDDDGIVTGIFVGGYDVTDRVQVEGELGTTAARLNAIINNTRMAVLLMDDRQQCVFANAAAEDLTGYRLDELHGRRLHEVIHHTRPDGSPYPLEECPIDRAFPTRRQMRGEEIFVHKDGGFYPVAFTASPMLDDEGRPIGTVIEVRDITEEKARDAALRESEERFRNMADHAPVMMWVTEPNGRCSYLNRSWYDFTGQTREEAEGFGWLDATHPDDREDAEHAFLEANRRRESFRVEYRLRRHDGVYRWSIDAAAPRFGADGEFLGYIGSVIDIDERRESEEALRESEERYRTLFETIEVGFAIVEMKFDDGGNALDYRMVEVNPAFERHTGLANAEGRWVSELVPDLERHWHDSYGRVARTRMPVRFENGAAPMGGRWFDVYAFPVGEPEAGRVGILFSDISERRSAEIALQRSETRLRTVLDAVPAAVWITDSPEAKHIDGNSFSNALLRLDDGTNMSLSADSGERPTGYRVLDEHGNELAPEQLPVQRAARGERVRDFRETVRFEDGSEVHLFGNAEPLIDASGQVGGSVAAFVDITQLKRAEQHQRLLIDELSHRSKNLLAIIQSIAQQSFRNGHTPAAMLSNFEGRLGALAAAHGILTRQRWESAPIRQVLCDTITAVKSDDHRLVLDGPDVMLSPKTSVSLAMAVHELTTNALKYGSFSNDEGTVAVTWSVGDDRLRLEWRERGGPAVEAPSRRGFGSRMIERGLAAELGGKVKIDFQPDGVVCRVDAPLPEPA